MGATIPAKDNAIPTIDAKSPRYC